MARNPQYLQGNGKHFVLSENWAEPYVLDELAVDQRKVGEISSWLSNHRNTCGILLLTGPTGCGKTAAVKCTARSLGFEVREWVTPLDRNFESGADIGFFQNQTEKFEDYLYSCSRYADLFVKSSSTSSLLLVEDYPNIFLLKPEIFHDVLGKYCRTSRAPIVFICSDVADHGLNIERELFPLDVQGSLGITHIVLNPVTRTRMLQALKRMGSYLQSMSSGYKLPAPDILNEICDSANGDVRYAMLSLQMKPQEDVVSLFDFAGKKGLGKKRPNSLKLTREEETVSACGKDDRVSILHAVGRVLYPKWYEGALKPNSSSTKRKRKGDEKHLDATVPDARWVHDPNTIVDAYCSTASSFLLFIQENYLKTFSTIESVAAASQFLSSADVMMTGVGVEASQEMSLNVAVRGVMVNNKVPNRIFNQVRGSRHWELLKTQTKLTTLTDSLFPLYPVSHTVLLTDVIPFMSHSCTNSLSNDQRRFVSTVASMSSLTQFCENFRTFKEPFRQQKCERATFVIDKQKQQSSDGDEELHISEDDTDEEVDEGAANLTMLEAVLAEEDEFDEGARNLSMLEAAIIEDWERRK